MIGSKRIVSQRWKVSFHDDFDAEFDAFSTDVQDQLLAMAAALAVLGPAAGRPHVGTLKNPQHPNMKELRFKANNGAEIWRAAFAFDTQREAVILVAADKQGSNEEQFYKDLLCKANERYSQHLKQRKALDGAHCVPAVSSARANKASKVNNRR